MSMTRQILQSLPATMPEIATQLGITNARANKLLCWLRSTGRVRLSERFGARHQPKGPAPRMWERT